MKKAALSRAAVENVMRKIGIRKAPLIKIGLISGVFVRCCLWCYEKKDIFIGSMLP